MESGGFLYEWLPFWGSLVAWRSEFIAQYIDVYLWPIFTGFALNTVIEAYFGPVFGSLLNFMGDMATLSFWIGNLSSGLVFVLKGVLEFPVFLILLLAPYLGVPFAVLLFSVGLFKFCKHISANEK